MKRALIVAGLIAASWSALAQGQLNFSGMWKQNMAKSSKTSLQSYTQKIEHTGNVLKVTTITRGFRGESSFDKTYEIGKERKSSDKEGDQFTSVVMWEGPDVGLSHLGEGEDRHNGHPRNLGAV